VPVARRRGRQEGMIGTLQAYLARQFLLWFLATIGILTGVILVFEFVELLRRTVALSRGVSGAQGEEALPPIRTLDGFGRLAAPPATALALAAGEVGSGPVGPRHPPGYYGSDGSRRAHNLATALADFAAFGETPGGVARKSYARSQELDLGPWLLVAALLLGLADLAVSLVLRGLAWRQGARAATAVIGGLLLAGALAQPEARAQSAQSLDPEQFALEATRETRLAYVRTGVPAVDEVSRAGLFGLTRMLQLRTSVEAGAPLGIDPDRDEVLFFPLLYWPVAPEQRSLGEQGRRRIERYLGTGGTILFDLREPGSAVQLFGRSSRGSQALQRLTEGLEIPPLEPVPPDHVLTKSFYLMQDFPGRFAGGTLWIGETEGRVNDGVASVMVGANDWAAAWAVGELGQPLFAVVPGGERQREMAYRVGINMVMFALTGNYKADQVHVPFILERLGQ